MSNVPQGIRVQRSVFDSSGVAEWLRNRYALDVTGVCLLSYGINDHYNVSTRDGDVAVLRIYAPGLRKRSEIEAECDFSNHLHRSQVSVAVPIAATDGALVGTIEAPEGRRAVVLLSHAAGRPAETGDATAYGVALARLHDAADWYSDSRRKPLDIDFWLRRPLEVVGEMLSTRPNDQAMLAKFGSELDDRLSSIDLDALGWGFCHGDAHGGNAHVEGSTVTFFDLDFCGPSWRAFELAVYRWGVGLRGDDEAWEPFLAAYRQVRQLTEQEVASIDTFVWVRHLWWIALQGEIRSFGSASSLSERFLDRVISSLRTRSLKWD